MFKIFYFYGNIYKFSLEKYFLYLSLKVLDYNLQWLMLTKSSLRPETYKDFLFTKWRYSEDLSLKDNDFFLFRCSCGYTLRDWCIYTLSMHIFLKGLKYNVLQNFYLNILNVCVDYYFIFLKKYIVNFIEHCSLTTTKKLFLSIWKNFSCQN